MFSATARLKRSAGQGDAPRSRHIEHMFESSNASLARMQFFWRGTCAPFHFVARSIWTGVITFGMVSIPVRLFPATQDKDVSFHLMHEKDHGRIKFKRFC